LLQGRLFADVLPINDRSIGWNSGLTDKLPKDFTSTRVGLPLGKTHQRNQLVFHQGHKVCYTPVVIVPENVHISTIGLSDASHDPKLAPLIIVNSPQAEMDVRDTHRGQHPFVIRAWRADDRKKYREYFF
jgi:hypothetical protein